MRKPGIILVLAVPGAMRACLHAAVAAARAFADARIEVLHVRIDPADTVLPSEEVLTTARRQAIEREEAAAAAMLAQEFAAWAGEPLSVGSPATPARPPASWQEVIGNPGEALRDLAPGADLLVLPSPGQHPHPLQRDGLDVALFETGKPLLVIPPAWRGGFGTHLAVGWRDDPATRQAIAAAGPWLAVAEQVTLLEVTDAPLNAAVLPIPIAPERLNHQMVHRVGRHDGEALLAATAACGADGLVMGAYRRGRLLEWVLGGVTEYVLRAATLPVLLRH